MSDSSRSENAAEGRESKDYLPTASVSMLQFRSRVLSWIRRFFESRGYWEVETPLLSHEIIIDAHLEPFVTSFSAGGENRAEPGEELFLQTSPELGMKRLLVAGAKSIYQITRSFRNGEVGRYHNPEFTMLEWYRVGDTHREQMDFVEELVCTIYGQIQDWLSEEESRPVGTSSRSEKDWNRPFLRLSYDEAFQKYAGASVLKLTAEELSQLTEQRGIAPPSGLDHEDRDGWLNLLLAELVEPHLGKERPTFIVDYPASQAALACIRPERPPVAERFELYIDGMEICNGYHELTDAEELRRRMREQGTIRAREGHRPLPDQSRLLEAMEAGLPPCAGVALGVDRLLMVALGAESLAEVMAFPFPRA